MKYSSLILTIFLNLNSTFARVSLPPYCNMLSKFVSDADISRIQLEDSQRRELLIIQALGPERMLTIENALGVPPLSAVSTEAEALAIVSRMMDEPQVYGPVVRILNDLPSNRSWALYLNTGFHAVSTYTDGHRDMVQKAIREFPHEGSFGPARVLDVGIGNGNLVIAAAVDNSTRIVTGIDFAGAGHTISTMRMNDISDIATAKFNDPGMERTGRFMFGRGSATDPHMFRGQQFDGASMVLTLFAIPPSQRKAALKNVFESLAPGARFVLMDPIPKANTADEGRLFLRTIVSNAWQNNRELTALDVAILTAKNAHGLLKIDFLSPETQKEMAEEVGFRAVAGPEIGYYGLVNMQIFEKPAR